MPDFFQCAYVSNYGEFVPILDTVMSVIHGLNQGLKRQWSKACDNAFESLRRQLASQSVLVHCDVNM